MELAGAAPLGGVLLGFLLGMRHATEADHLIAVTTIVSRERTFGLAAFAGMSWGLGHMTTILLVGAAVVGLGATVPPRLESVMELAVAGALVVLGISRLLGEDALGRGGRSSRPGTGTRDEPIGHAHAHNHGGQVHAHAHAHLSGRSQGARRSPLASGRRPAVARPLVAAFGMGLLHGLAGSAAVALLVLGAIPDPVWAIAYLLLFGFGSLLGMAVTMTVISLPFVLAAGRLAGLHRAFRIGSGLLSISIGLVLDYQTIMSA